MRGGLGHGGSPQVVQPEGVAHAEPSGLEDLRQRQAAGVRLAAAVLPHKVGLVGIAAGAAMSARSRRPRRGHRLGSAEAEDAGERLRRQAEVRAKRSANAFACSRGGWRGRRRGRGRGCERAGDRRRPSSARPRPPRSGRRRCAGRPRPRRRRAARPRSDRRRAGRGGARARVVEGREPGGERVHRAAEGEARPERREVDLDAGGAFLALDRHGSGVETGGESSRRGRTGWAGGRRRFGSRPRGRR